MNIEIKYPLGYTYYAPRVYNKYKKIEKEIDDELYYKEEIGREIVIKKRIVKRILIDMKIDQNTRMTYQYHHDDIFGTAISMEITNDKVTYMSNDLQFDTYEKAMEFATKWYNEHPGEEYFG